MKCLLTIELYKITATEIGKLKDQQIKNQHIFKFLPEYCVDIVTGKLRDADAWLQFIDEGHEYFYMFNVLHIDQPLKEEISNSGIEILEEYNFKFFQNLKHYSYDEMFKSIPLPIHLVFDVNYIGDQWDAELDLNFLGYLNDDLNLVALSD